MDISGGTRLYGVVGQPVAHSLSPAIHNFLFRRLGVDGVYVPLPTGPRNLGRLLVALAGTSFAGLNVTTPHKEAALRLALSSDASARASGGANTLVRRGRGWKALSTDGEGLCAFLEGELRVPLAGRRVVVLGAGPAARSLVHALVRRSSASLTVVNRSPGRLRAAPLRRLAARGAVTACVAGSAEARTALGECQVLVHATSWGGAASADAPAPWDLGTLPGGVLAVDCNYGAGATPFLALLPRAVEGHDGRGMLRWQAARAFQAWTGLQPGPADMRALRAHLAKLDRHCAASI